MELQTRRWISIGMQQRAGLLFLAKTTGRILLILDAERWTVPTFQRSNSLLEDAGELLNQYAVVRWRLKP